MIGRTNAVVKIGGGIVEDAGTGEFEARYCFFDKYGKYQIINKYADIMGTFEKPSTVGDVPENVGYNPALIFQGWNFDDIELTNVTGDLDIGAIYIPADGKTHVYIEINNTNLLTYTFNVTLQGMTLSANAVFHFDFGDGTAEYTANSDGLKTISHTYASLGKYHLKLWIENRVIGINESTPTRFLLGTSATYDNAFVGNYYNSLHNSTIKRIYSGIDIYRHQSACIPQLRQCEIITLHNKIVQAELQYYIQLQHFTYPKSITSFKTSANSSFRFYSMPLQKSFTQEYVRSNYDKLIINNVFVNTLSGENIMYFKVINIINTTSVSIGNQCGALKISTPTNLTAFITGQENYYTSPLQVLVMRNSTPPTLSGTVSKNTRIYIPQGSKTAYESASNWLNYVGQFIEY